MFPQVIYYFIKIIIHNVNIFISYSVYDEMLYRFPCWLGRSGDRAAHFVESARVTQIVAGSVSSPERRRGGATVDAFLADVCEIIST